MITVGLIKIVEEDQDRLLIVHHLLFKSYQDFMVFSQ